MRNVRRVLWVSLCLILSWSAMVFAAQRTFVSTGGSDANPCTAAAPCRSFGAALLQTNANGEIVAVDSGGYGPVTIDKSVTIVAAPGVHAAISVLSGDGIVIDGLGPVVTLRNLAISGLGGNYGVRILSAGQVYVEGCHVTNLTLVGVRYENADNWSNGNVLVIHDSTIARNDYGVQVAAEGSFTIHTTISDSRIVKNNVGVLISSSGFNRTTIVRSLLLSNTTWALYQIKDSGLSALTTVESSVIAGNSGGIRSDGLGGPSYVRVSNSTITGNTGTALSALNGGNLLSRQNNTFEDNVTAGAFSGTYTAK